MSKVLFTTFAQSIFSLNVFLLLSSIMLSLIIHYGVKFVNSQELNSNTSSFTFVKPVLNFTILSSFFLVMYIFWLYLRFVNEKSSFYFLKVSNIKSFSNFNESLNILMCGYQFSFEMVGLIFTLLAYMVGLISVLSLDTRLYWKNIKLVFVCYFLVFAVVIFCSTNDLLILFLAYEALLVPSFLFVYYIAPNRRAIQASIYFLIWTQIGSFLVLCAVAYIIVTTGTTSISLIKSFVFTNTEINWIYALLFFGFGIKTPIWPMHYWITKTHVEAPAGFSIFLSGFLVKSAIYGFYKISNLLGGSTLTIVASTFCYIGVIDASMKMWAQTDLKKAVAYATIQEMNIIYLTVCWGDSTAIIGGFLFCITHAFFLSFFFFLVDCIQKRYGSRSILEVCGIIHTTPNLGVAVLFGVVLYSGLPGTLKFISEFYIFCGLLEAAPLSCCILLFCANFFGLLGFLKGWLNCVFGMTAHNQDKIPADLNHKDFLIILVCVLCLVFFTFVIKIYL